MSYINIHIMVILIKNIMLVCMLDVKQNAVDVLLYFLKAGMMPERKLNLACVGMYGV